MSLVNKAKLLLIAFHNTAEKRKIPSKIWKELSKGGLTRLKHAVITVSTRQKDDIIVECDIYEYQQKLEMPKDTAIKSISVIIEIGNQVSDIKKTIESLHRQSYKNYSITFVAPENHPKNEEDTFFYYKKHPGEVYDKILPEVKQDYVFVIRAGNLLHPNALLLFAQKVEAQSPAIVYCDECIFDGADDRKLRYFIKPDYSPVYELCSLYMEQGVLFSVEIIKKIQGFLADDIVFSARINDAVLKALQVEDSALHVNRIILLRNSLYEENNLYHKASVINNALNRTGYIGNSCINHASCTISLKYDAPRVSIVIPTDDFQLIQKCIRSILATTDYPTYEIITVTSSDLCGRLKEEYGVFSNITYVVYEDTFNYSGKCNAGAASAKGEIILFLQDSATMTDMNWLRKIIACFAFEQIGAVSPKIVRADNTIRYAGLISGGFGFYPIPFNGESNELKEGANEPAFASREVTILSATCLAVRKELLEKAGGWNETDTPDKFSNVELSYQVKILGKSCFYCADSVIRVDQCDWYDSWYYKGSDSAYIYILKKYADQLEYDPYFTNEMKYLMLKSVPADVAFYHGHNTNKSGKAILLVSHELSLTGAPIALHYAAKAIREAGNYAVVISPYDGKLRNELISDGIDVIINSSINGSDFWVKWAMNFDMIIVSTLVQYSNINQLKDKKIPVLWWVHESRESYRLGADKLLPAEIGKNINVYCGGGYARAMLKEYRPAYPTEELLYCVPDYADQAGREYKYILEDIEGKVVFSTIGTIEERKGQDIFAKAIMALPKEYIEKCRFFIVGRKINDIIYGDLLRLKEAYPEQITLINEVSRDEIKDLYNQCDSIVCSSIDDPMPVFMTECLMLSKIAICSENTGTASLLQDGVDGFVYKNNDYRELMNKMIYVIDHINDLDSLKARGRRTYEQYFTKEAFDKKISSIINKLLKEDN